MLLVDEFGKIDPERLMSIVPPMLKADGNFAILMSSRPEIQAYNTMSENIQKCETYGNVVYMEVTSVCAACHREKKDICHHKIKNEQPFIASNPEANQHIYDMMGMGDVYLRENQGITVRTDIRVYHEENISQFMNRDRGELDVNLQTIFIIGADPNDGGRCDLGFAITAYQAGKTVIIIIFFYFIFFPLPFFLQTVSFFLGRFFFFFMWDLLPFFL